MRVTVESRIEPTPRVQQVVGLFDLPEAHYSRQSWDVVNGLDLPPAWSIGLVTGPSGSGKSTLARALFPPGPATLWDGSLSPWPAGRAVIDGFPDAMSVREVTALLCVVGFSSPPAWLRPYRVLSTGQRFRCDLARLIAHAGTDPVSIGPADSGSAGPGPPHGTAAATPGPAPHPTTPPAGPPAPASPAAPGDDCPVPAPSPATAPLSPVVAVMDEFTSVVDRTVAKIGSAAVAKAVRARPGLRFVAVSCHDDVIDWLQPDWVYQPATDTLTRRLLQRRPALDLTLYRTTAQAWRLFAPHHYLSSELNHSAACFVATLADDTRPVAFSAWINQMSLHGGKREHRTVVLPDYQGAGIGMALSDTLASLWSALGLRATSTTTHPAFIAARRRSPNWRMTRRPALAGAGTKLKHACTRLTAGFVYVGPKMNVATAHQLLAGRLP